MSWGWGFRLPVLSQGRIFVHNDCPRGRVFPPSSRVSRGGMVTDEIDSRIRPYLIYNTLDESKRAAKCNFFVALYPLSTQSNNKVHFEVQVIDFQKVPVVLSKCGAIAKESTFKIGHMRGL